MGMLLDSMITIFPQYTEIFIALVGYNNSSWKRAHRTCFLASGPCAPFLKPKKILSTVLGDLVEPSVADPAPLWPDPDPTFQNVRFRILHFFPQKYYVILFPFDVENRLILNQTPDFICKFGFDGGIKVNEQFFVVGQAQNIF